MNIAPHRSYLFVPGNRPERFDKALASGADTIILDLEDAVPPDAKDGARDSVANWLDPARPVCCGSTRSRPAGSRTTRAWRATPASPR